MSSLRVPLTVVPIGRVCGTGIGIACTQVTDVTSYAAAKSSTASVKASHAKSGS